MNLPDRIYETITLLSEEGNALYDDSAFEGAISKWSQALNLLPTPQASWEAFTWLSASIGDAFFQLGQYPESLENLKDALNGPDGLDNSFIHYRIGQCQTLLGFDDEAITSLLKAYMLDGDAVFKTDPDGEVYLQKLKVQHLIDD
ncbi:MULTISPECIES: tetratricopeptide repeat protein [unclassified Pseudomonas]|uniref:tetratricopeptide repeat protein n=1 Tax=unclassified Pseudomonas TaxID=196821 RepID=UPI001F5632A4|nr:MULTISPECIES: tetratricopeptide repeat protein [unclassified Pseudomonas]